MRNEVFMSFPKDVDGDVLRLFEENGFNFEEVVEVDFNIDFNHWPLNNNEKEAIEKLYPDCVFYDPDTEDIEDGNLIGYVQFTVLSKIDYQFIINTQKNATNQMTQFGGWCDSWGVYTE
jgi:hypothetical protein